MKRFLTTLSVVLLAAGVAGASQDDEGCHGNCPSGGGDVSVVTGASAAAAASGSAISGSSAVAIEYEANAASPGALILGTCQAGLTAQTQMGGGSMGGPDEVCLLFTLAQMQAHFGLIDESRATLARAETILKWRGNVVRRAFQAIPLLGRIF